MKKIYFTLLIVGQIVFAQNKVEKDTTKSQELENIFVTANRTATLRKETPVAISKITAKTINETKATAVYEIINKTPGVLMVNLGNEQHMMSIRQPMTTNAYYLYLEDGLPIRPMGIFNHNALLEINQYNLQSIEVVKGPVSSLYGPEAVGGTINLISLKPPVDPEFKFGVQADNYGYRRFQAAGGATIGKVGFHIAGISSLQENGWMTYSDYNKDNLNARIDYNISPSTRLISNTMYGKYYSDMSGTVNEDAFNNRTYKSTSNFTYRKSDALRTRLTLEHDWNSNSSSYITAYLRDNKLGQNPSYGIKWSPTVNPTTAKGEVNSNNFKSYGAIGQHTQKFDFLNAKLVAGALYDYSPVTYWSYVIDLKANLNPGTPGKQTVDSYEIIAEHPDSKLADYTADIFNTAGYAQLSFNPIEKLVITIGGRYDNMKVNYDNALDNSTGSKVYDKMTFKAGANYNPFEFAGFYGNYSQGFAPPGITSIFRTKPGTGGTTGVPADFYYNLEPATFNNYEVGGWFSFLQNKLNFDYAFYYMEGKNELLNIKLPDNSTDYRSAGETRHKGIEFGASYRPSKQFNIRFGGTYAQHTYIDFKLSDKPSDPIQDLNGKEMPAAPKWSGNSEVSYYPNWLPNLRTSVEWQLVGSYYQDQINTVKYSGYNIFNARVGYQWKKIEIYGNVLNLTDKLYAYNVSRANTTNAQPTYTAAAPRTFVFGIQYNFSLKK
ncbi:outer membrane receptor protein involved in Fe transport [Flavobacterium sp. 90]|uniref:TonB-dependent receptor n=1 Tax=unclassified Flavobacterium TaxID=196869 RepID=UPI000EAD7DB4|nr:MULTISPECIES: TonB-dependent receptor [unclassified Flavobacterium]RKR11353.1 outer membrane receptor protein involved in Fe transport [Flavobacterium sp. 81]TCK55134.1 outer membrane receptor protein involved in Fe transport [Flavobacterium sp. 90]